MPPNAPLLLYSWSRVPLWNALSRHPTTIASCTKASHRGHGSWSGAPSLGGWPRMTIYSRFPCCLKLQEISESFDHLFHQFFTSFSSVFMFGAPVSLPQLLPGRSTRPQLSWERKALGSHRPSGLQKGSFQQRRTLQGGKITSFKVSVGDVPTIRID